MSLSRRFAIACCLLFPALAAAPGAAADELPAYQPRANAPRSAVPEVYRWDLSPLFESGAAWAAEVDRLEGAIGTLGSLAPRLDDPAGLAEALGLYFDLHDAINRTTLYANLQLATASSSDEAQAMQTRSLALMDRLSAEAAPLRERLLRAADDEIAAAFAAVPGLSSHAPYVENLRRRRGRLLSREGERLLALAGDNLWAEIDLNEIPSAHEKTFSSLMADMRWPMVHGEDGEPLQLTLSNYPRLRQSKNRKVRREAVEALLGTLRQYQHAFAGALSGQYQFDVFLARARGYQTALDAYLDKDGLDPSIYHTLIDTVNEHLEPLHRYVELRKRLLGTDDLHLYDLYVPLVAEVSDEVPFETARETILAALAPLGPEYGRILAEGLDPREGWIDLYPHADKQSGAFSASVYGRHPYVLMNYMNSTDDMFTLAHEFGHAAHSRLAMSAQPYSAFRYVPFLAEIASTCNEALLGDYLIGHAASRDQKAALLVQRLEDIRTTIYRQTLFAEFELAAHGFVERGVPLTAALLDETYAGLVRRYYGPGFTVDADDGMEWAYVPHFYYKYYVYTYATGLSSGIALARQIREQGQPAARRYLGMLAGGASKPPLDLLREGGVDLRSPQPIEAALRSFSEALDELEALLEGKP